MLFMFKKVPRIGLIFCCSLLVLVEFLSLFLVYKSWNNKPVKLDNVILQNFTKNKGLAILIEQEDGTYKESTNNSWPEDMMFNEEKSGCLDSNGKAIENSLTYENGIATIKSNSTSYCYLYFDIIKDDVIIAVNTDGKSGVMPSSGAYTNSATCTSGSITWSDKYQRIEVGDFSVKQMKCNVNFTKDTSSKTLLKAEVESKATTNANGYRYSGKQPNNYVWFNNEMWRIIGSIPVCLSASCGTNTTNLVKIMRNESLGGYVFDKASAVSWGGNSLSKLLNSYYYGAKDGSDSECYGYNTSGILDCDYTVRGIQSDGYYGKMVKNVYWNTGTVGEGINASSAYTSEMAIQTTKAYVGLMAESDYGYAADSSYHTTSLSSYSNLYITGSNWMYSQGMEWTLTPSSSGGVIDIDDAGWCAGGAGVSNGFATRPVVYLDSSVFIIEGNGSITNPYIIGM